ncbi:MAG: class I SAM-dependent methyltransferase [Thermoplasmata archaeon]|nr:class I SAM-dependent methyltransferase [Thermoplasmata archaeon]
MKTDYSRHEKVYVRLKKSGKTGWDDEECVADNVNSLMELMQAEYIPRFGNMLELGCGTGDLILNFSNYKLFGIDISPTAIAWAKENADKNNINADLQTGNVLDLSRYPDDFFEIILDGHCFHCIIADDRKIFLSSAMRVLRPSGIMIIATMCGEITDENIKEHFNEGTRCIEHNGFATRYIGSVDDILDEIQQAGFRIIDKKLKTRKSMDDQDELFVICSK